MAIVYTQAQLDALNEILLTGAGEVQIGDRKIRYRDQDQILALIKMVQENLAAQVPAAEYVETSRIQITYTKGES